MNWRAIWAIYVFEMARARRTLLQSLVSPVVSTALYFVVFGSAIGSRIAEVEGVSYGAFAKREPDANRALVGQLFAWVREGRLRPRISATYGLGDAAAALDALSALERRCGDGDLALVGVGGAPLWPF